MEILAIIFSLWLIIALALIPYNSKWGIAMFLAYMFLVPVTKIQFGGFDISDRIIYLVMTALLLFRNYQRLRDIDYQRFAPFAFLLLAQGLLIPLQDGVPFGFAFNAWVNDILKQLLFPLMVFLLVLVEDDAWGIFKRVILVCGAIFTLYGLFLTTMPGINPYLIFTLPIFGEEFNEAYALGYSGVATSYSSYVADGRLFGRISSVFTHPMTYTLNLGFLGLFCAYHFRKKAVWLYASIAIIVFAIFTSGVRTSIAAIGLTVILILLYLRNFKYAIWVAVGSISLLTAIFYLFPTMQEYVLSIVDSNSDAVKGSSMEMRFEQYEGCFNIIKDCVFAGKGYEWTSYYVAEHGPHPVLLSFESLIYMVLCNTGIAGAVIWTIFIAWTVYDIHGFFDRNARTLLLALFVFFIIFALATGNYGYMRYFTVFYAVALGFCYHSDEEDEEGEYEEYEDYEDYEDYEEEISTSATELCQ